MTTEELERLADGVAMREDRIKAMADSHSRAVREYIKMLKAAESHLATATELLRDMQAMLEQLPMGIDKEADENDTSPKDLVAHIGGVMWKRLAAFLEEAK